MRALWLTALTVVICLGCSVEAIFDDTLLREAGLSETVSLPTGQPALEIVLSNDVTDDALDVLIAVEYQRTDGTRFKFSGTGEFGVSEIFNGVRLSRTFEFGRLFPCSDEDAIEAITMGKLDDPTAPGAAVVFPNGAITVLVPFGTILRRGVHYNCGQALRFSVSDDPVDSTEWRPTATVFCDRTDCGRAPSP